MVRMLGLEHPPSISHAPQAAQLQLWCVLQCMPQQVQCCTRGTRWQHQQLRSALDTFACTAGTSSRRSAEHTDRHVPHMPITTAAGWHTPLGPKKTLQHRPKTRGSTNSKPRIGTTAAHCSKAQKMRTAVPSLITGCEGLKLLPLLQLLQEAALTWNGSLPETAHDPKS